MPLNKWDPTSKPTYDDLFFIKLFLKKKRNFKQLTFHLNYEFDHEFSQLMIGLTMLSKQIDMKPFYKAPWKFKL